MTDNDIVKALEQLHKEQEEGYTTALEFGGKRDAEHEKFLELLAETIDLINRQQAEIERLDKELRLTREYIHGNELEWDLVSYAERTGKRKQYEELIISLFVELTDWKDDNNE